MHPPDVPDEPSIETFPVPRENFVRAQQEDPTLANCFSSVVDWVEASELVTVYLLEQTLAFYGPWPTTGPLTVQVQAACGKLKINKCVGR